MYSWHGALDRKDPNIPAECIWLSVFFQEHRWTKMSTREEGWDHIHETIIQCAAKDAIKIRLNNVDRQSDCSRVKRERIEIED